MTLLFVSVTRLFQESCQLHNIFQSYITAVISFLFPFDIHKKRTDRTFQNLMQLNQIGDCQTRASVFDVAQMRLSYPPNSFANSV